MLYSMCKDIELVPLPEGLDLERPLAVGDNHPAVWAAAKWLSETLRDMDCNPLRLALAERALAGDENARLCLGTLERLLTGGQVSDRYLLALCWTLRDAADAHAASLNQGEDQCSQ